MANNVENATVDFAEQLFETIDAITMKRLEHIHFDKTLTCQIIDVTNSEKGEYIVSDGVTDFIAYSENASYSEGTWVYVSVPNGDFNEQKHIVGKYIADNSEYSTYRNPLDSYIDITGNLLDDEADATFGLVANNNLESQIVIWQTGELSTNPYSSSIDTKEEYMEKIQQGMTATEEFYTSGKQRLDDALNNATISQEEYDVLLKDLQDRWYAQVDQYLEDQLEADTTYKGQQLSNFDRLGIQANFKTLLNSYGLISGTYGLRLCIKMRNFVTTTSEPIDQYVSIDLSSDEMFGNPYNFLSWSQQQYVFDISEFSSIVGMALILYQDNNFRDSDGNFIPGYAQYLDEDQTTFTPEWQSYISMKNILVKDIFISLGYDLTDFTSDTVLLFSDSSLSYTSVLDDKSTEFINSLNEGLEPDDEEYININTAEGFAKALKIINTKNIYLRWIHIDPETRLIQAIDSIYDIGTWETENEVLPLAKIHWYRFKMDTDVKDELGGGFWEEINLNEIYAQNHIPEEGEEPFSTENSYDWFEYEDMIPDPSLQFERFKVIIEYPCREYLSQLADENVEDYILTNRDEWEVEVTDELYSEDDQNEPEFPNLDQYSAIQVELAKRIREEKQYYKNSVIGQCLLYKSPIIEFNNEQEVPNETLLELIRDLEIVCDEVGYKGIYRIYSDDGQIMNSREATIPRILSAGFSEILTEDDDGKMTRVQNVRWYFPLVNTMIAEPTNGCEFFINEEDHTSSDYTSFAGIYNRENIENGKIPAGLSVSPNGSWFIIERTGVPMTSAGEHEVGDSIFNSLDQYFRIKSQYLQTATNNTIKCEILKDNRTYSAEITLYFGISGSKGTDYTVTVTYEEAKYQYELNEDGSIQVDNENHPIIKYKEDGITPDYKWSQMITPVFYWNRETPIRLVPHIFDYTNNEITNDYIDNIQYMQYSGPVTGYDGLIGTQEGKYYVIQKNTATCTEQERDNQGNLIWDDGNGNIVSEDIDGAQPHYLTEPSPQSFYHYIIKLIVEHVVTIIVPPPKNNEPISENTAEEEQTLEINLTTCCPIAVSFDDIYKNLDGDDRITYDISGVNPIYYKGNYALYKENNELASNIRWYVDLGNEQSAIDQNYSVYSYYPQIDATSGQLFVPSLYTQNLEPTISIIALEKQEDNTNKPVWCQPLYISQNVYSSSFLNAWTGQLNIDAQGNSIMSAIIGAGEKNEDNQFNGVLIGTVDQVMPSGDVGTGLFGFHEGSPSFGFNVDGTAFIGKSNTTGQIIFNGDEGIIQSSNFQMNPVTNHVTAGLQINLRDGILYATEGSLGGWHISANYLYSDAGTSGVVLYGGQPSDSAISPRIEVGNVNIDYLYYIYVVGGSSSAINDVDSDSDNIALGTEGTVGYWQQITDPTAYANYQGQKYRVPQVSASYVGFRVTKNGQLTAVDAILPRVSIGSTSIDYASISSATITSATIGYLNITAAMYWGGTQITLRTNTYGYGITSDYMKRRKLRYLGLSPLTAKNDGF